MREWFPRLKAARRRRKEAVWWREQLSGSGKAPFSSRLLAVMACLVLATTSVIIELSNELSELLDAFDAEEWASAVQLISEQLDRDFLVAKPDTSSKELPPSQSHRLSFFVALRSNRAAATRLFLRDFLDVKDENLAIAEFRQTRAFDAALSNELDWSAAMAIVRATYKQGAAYQIRRLGLIARMPDQVANEVLAVNPSQYPVTVWEIAESVASAKARKAVKAVGPIAKAEKWFAN